MFRVSRGCENINHLLCTKGYKELGNYLTLLESVLGCLQQSEMWPDLHFPMAKVPMVSVSLNSM